MARPDFKFVITEVVRVKVNLERKLAVILVKTKDGKLLELDADCKTINKIHDENRDQIVTKW